MRKAVSNPRKESKSQLQTGTAQSQRGTCDLPERADLLSWACAQCASSVAAAAEVEVEAAAAAAAAAAAVTDA